MRIITFVFIILFAAMASAGTIVGSKHDMTSLNARAGVEAMSGLSFNDYRDACIYCHIPEETKLYAPGSSQITSWNRYLGDGYILYKSESLSKTITELGPETLLCLSCHDGTQSVDMVINKPNNWTANSEAPMHMKISKGGGLDKCTQCHDGTTAHKMDTVSMGSSLMDTHPVGVTYPGMGDTTDFQKPTKDGLLPNGIKIFRGKVECASCHDVHSPDNVPFLRTTSQRLCYSCHIK